MNGDTSDELMHATYCALCKHGYADLTMQDIANESEKSKAALHYHYDSKHDLLLAFLDYLLEDFTAHLNSVTGESPGEHLRNFIDAALNPSTTNVDSDTMPETNAQREFRTALLEIKAQGPYDEAFRKKLLEFDQLLYNRVHAVVSEGIEQGTFRDDVDPDAAAEFFVTAFSGAVTRQVAIGRSVDTTEQVLLDYLETRLLTDPEVVAE